MNLPSKIENYTALHFLMNQKEENESGNIDSIVTDLMVSQLVLNLRLSKTGHSEIDTKHETCKFMISLKVLFKNNNRAFKTCNSIF